MMAPRIAGLMWFHSVPSLVTEMKSEPRNTPLTPGSSNKAAASGDVAKSRKHFWGRLDFPGSPTLNRPTIDL